MYRLLLFTILPLTSISQVDYRDHQSPVKNQANRGTCTAFAILAAMETMPGFPNDLSEQYVYAQAKMNHYKEMPKYSEGAFLKYYIDVLQRDGTVREDQAPYNPNSVVWAEGETSFEKMKKDISGSKLLDLLRFPDFCYKLSGDMYLYREDHGAKDVEWIKQQLDKGVVSIPVGYSINGRYWSRHQGKASAKIRPDDFMKVSYNNKLYPWQEAKKLLPDLSKKIVAGDIRFAVDTNYRTDGGHAVSIVGYDETGFLIKNSWGTVWGDKGYGWISFDYHILFCDELMVPVMGKISGDEYKEPVVINKADFRLKTLPHTYEGNKALNMPGQKGVALSISYHGSGRMPRLTEIVYKIFDSKGTRVETVFGTTKNIFDGRENGYNTYALMGKTFLSLSGYRVVAEFTTSTGYKFTCTYSGIERKNKEYEPS